MNDPSMALYTIAQARELDRLAITEHGLPGFELMQRAALAVWHDLRSRWPRARRLVVVCGPGNNGGDGFLLALAARRAGRDVAVLALGDATGGDARRARQAWLDGGGEIERVDTDMALPAADVYVDALFGSGFNRAAEGAAARLIEALNAASAPVLAIDVPSGLQADTGARLGVCVKAAATLCLVAWKQGLFTHEGVDCSGARSLARLGVPEAVYQDQTATAQLMTARVLPPRAKTSHKGNFGHVLVTGGNHGFGGAVRLAGEAALRCGAGLVSVATRREHVTALLTARPELMAHAVGDEGANVALLERVSVLVVGPGLGQDAWGQRLLQQALDSTLPLVLDADGLNLIASRDCVFSRRPVVVTPHPGEAARLLATDVPSIQADRFAAARTLARRLDCVVVLKGAGSLVAAPDGRVSVCPWGNPGMASGGMGDVLSGVIGALLAQHLDPWQAATLGVGLHARAGDRAAQSGARGLLASDLMPALRHLLAAHHG